MLFEKFRRKVAVDYIDKKSSGFSPFFVNFLTNDFTFAKNSLLYLQYYNQVAPVGDAINKIAQEAAMIEVNPYVYDEKEAEKPLVGSPFSRKLQKPNAFQSGVQFRDESFVHYMATGNNYIFATGVLNEAKDQIIEDPVEIFNLRPDFMTIVPDADYFPLFYLYNPQGRQRMFRRKLVKTRNGAWEEMYVEEQGFGVLMHFKEPSTNRVFTMLYGDSPLQNVELEIAQYLQASVHNTNLLKNGMSARMLFSFKDMPTASEDQMIKIKDKIETQYSGVNNSGKSMFSPIPMEAKPLDMNLKDMDFEKLMRRMRVAIYNKLNIPLPMVEGEFTSNTNMKESNLNFYDKAILPLMAKRNDFYFNFIYKVFYKDEGAFKIGFDPASIPALQTRLFDNVLLMQKSGTVTINEMREYQGLGPTSNGGNNLFIDANKAPVAGDENLTDGIGMPARSIAQEANDEEQEEDDFEEIDELDEEKGIGDIDLKPTESMASNAARGLELRKKHKRGGTMVGVARARDIVNRKELSPSTVARMVSFFARHESDKKGKGWKAGEEGYPSNGLIAWNLWGGDSGKTWADKKWEQIKRARETKEIEEKPILEEILKKHKDVFGKRLYSDQEIKSILN